MVKKYIQANPNCTYKDIKNDTKIKVERLYKNMKAAYEDANVKLSKNLTKRNKKEQKKDVINFIKNHPGCTVIQIQENTKVNVSRTFGTIINAYKKAKIKYPQKEVTSGVMDPFVIARCNKFEKSIIKKLNGLGEVESKIRTSAGIVDCLFNYNNQIFVVEIKDFRGKNNITMFEIKQLIRYMKALNYKEGLLICLKQSFPKRKNGRNIYIDNLRVRILSEEDLRERSINHL